MNKHSLDINDKKTCVYVHTNDDNDVLYVGISHQPLKRTRQHSKKKDWFDEVANIEMVWCQTRQEALKKERELIKKLKPRHNIQHNEAKKTSPVRSYTSFKKLRRFRRKLLVDVSMVESPKDWSLKMQGVIKASNIHRKWFEPYLRNDPKVWNPKHEFIAITDILKVVEETLVGEGFDLREETIVKICDAKFYCGVVRGCNDYACRHFEFRDMRPSLLTENDEN
ncbi:MAG: GIY-YIG nuclease family protein [Proteobacteria bacterium]|nr:GIY-YIG nuclease family protein [Pseudomonadota bacterium]MDA0852880.1 GIY-YIG nuclease family protein [Pseudomonadota bacterium]